MASRVGQSRDVGGGQRLAPREARGPRVDPVGGRRSSDEVLPPGKELAPPPGGGSSACYPVLSQDGMARLNPKPGTELTLERPSRVLNTAGLRSPCSRVPQRREASDVGWELASQLLDR